MRAAPPSQTSLFDQFTREPHFNGPVYDPSVDWHRLTKQHTRIRAFMLQTGAWQTLREISSKTGFPESSVSAQLRHLRKKRFGSYEVAKRHRGARKSGLWEYRVRSGDTPTEDRRVG
jgi:hypothetical protein